MATVSGVWNSYRGLHTTNGVYRSFYHPGSPNEYVLIIAPDEQQVKVPTPSLADWFLAAEDGKVTVYYARIDGNDKTEVRAVSTLACGQPAGATVTGGVGPIGPAGPGGARGADGPVGARGAPGAKGEDLVALSDADLDRIALRVWTMPPPANLKNISGADLGTLAQEVIAYNDTQRQDIKQLEIRRYDEAASNLLAEHYEPKTGK